MYKQILFLGACFAFSCISSMVHSLNEEKVQDEQIQLENAQDTATTDVRKFF